MLRGARRRERTRSQALDAAERLLSTRGPDAIRIEDIAAEAGISPATVYTHFGTKDALFADVTGRLLDTATATLAAAYASPETPFQRMQAAGNAYITFLLEHPIVARHIATDSPGLLAAERIAEQIDMLRRGFEAVIHAAIDAGELRPLDARLLSYFLFGAWNGVAALTHTHPTTRLTQDDVNAAIHQAMEILAVGASAPVR